VESKLRLAVDIGGTFTDFIYIVPGTGALETLKVPSTPADPARAVLDGLALIVERLGAERRAGWDITHGSTVATNALLERKGARTALITTAGFRDLLQIGRQNRPALYDLMVAVPEALIPDDLRFEIQERIDKGGKPLTPLTQSSLEQLTKEIKRANIESLAICLLFSFTNPAHELLVEAALQEPGRFISRSSAVLPEFREFERASTTAVNAYVAPVLSRYLEKLEASLQGSAIRIMQSNGGSMPVSRARQQAVQCILSGPAGGLTAASRVHGHLPPGLQALKGLITFDMGGTSTDVALLHDRPALTREALIGGMPIGIPMMDIHTIGAGGGSIARLDAGGALRVGPESAGAVPGPACYGRGENATVTDSNVLLGRILPEKFLGGRIPLSTTGAEAALRRIGDAARLTPHQVAAGILQIANAHMARAIRLISVERGYDLREYGLLSFGGAGGLHAVDLAHSLGIPTVIVPAQAAVFSAYGMLVSDVIRDTSKTVMLNASVPQQVIDEAYEPLILAAQADLAAEDVPPERQALELTIDMRYAGQSYEINLPYSADFRRAFAEQHQQFYGFARPELEIEIVTLRVRAIGRQAPVRLEPAPRDGADAGHAIVDHRPVYLDCETGKPFQPVTIPVYDGERLRHGNAFQGPALVVRPDTTVIIDRPDRVEVDAFGSLLITLAGMGENDTR
jgi:N-methylhydantoinase A